MKVLKFYAEWCGPCKVVGQNLKNANLPIRIEDLDVEDNEGLVLGYRVRSVPTTILIDNEGNEVKRWLGIFNVDELKQLI